MNPTDVKAFLAAMSSPDAAVRDGAGKDVPRLSPADAGVVLPGLADLMGSADPATAKAAKSAMERFVHQSLAPPAGKDHPDGRARSGVADALREIAASPRPRLVRAHALALLGFAGDGRDERAIAGMEPDPDLGQNARMARRRIRSVRY